MAKVAIVYWSGSGNTEAMAQAVEEGAKAAGAETTLSFVSDTTASDVAAYDHIILGCPAMGNEELEEYEFEPLFAECEGKLEGKKVALFGSYGWGDGPWMRDWEERCRDHKISLVSESMICQEEPDEEALENCRGLGKALA